MRQLPIRVKLTLWYTAVFSIALAVFGVAAWLLVRHRLVDDVEDQLQARATSVQHFLDAQNPALPVEQLKRELKEEYEVEDHADWLTIVDSEKRLLFRSAGVEGVLPSTQTPSALPVQGKYSEARSGHTSLLVLEKPIPVGGRVHTVQVAIPTNGVHRVLESLRNILLLLGPCILFLAGGGSYLLARQALRPVDAISASARRIHEHNLEQRLPTLRSNDEVQRLSETLNAMLARIETSFRQVQQFTADASHELRTPISLIRTEAELSLRKTRTADEHRAALAHILQEAERTTHLIENLLMLARSDAAKEVVRSAPIRLDELLRSIASDWRIVFEDANLGFTTELPEAAVWVEGDEPLLRRLMVGVLDNARRYTPEGTVTLFAQEEPGQIRIGVSDTGIGIAQEHLPHIFDRFYRADPARTRDHGGNGLGLPLAAWIAAQHRTEIKVVSVPNHGSTFSFCLPIVAAPANQSQSPMTEERVS